MRGDVEGMWVGKRAVGGIREMMIMIDCADFFFLWPRIMEINDDEGWVYFHMVKKNSVSVTFSIEASMSFPT